MLQWLMSKVVDLKAKRSGGRGGPLNAHGLTLREENFANRVSLGDNYSEAYRKSYDASNMQAGTVWKRAFEVAHRPNVQERIKGLTEEVADTERSRGIRAKAFIEERLWIEASSDGSKASDRLKALELLGKLDHVGAFKERTEVTDAATPEDIKARIEELVKKAG